MLNTSGTQDCGKWTLVSNEITESVGGSAISGRMGAQGARPLQQLQQLHPTSSKGLMLVFLKHSLLDIAVAGVVLCQNTDWLWEESRDWQ
jgi:hypothetical protein